MFISSSFKDYYDFVHGYNAQDDYPIYNRYQSVEKIYESEFHKIVTSWYRDNKSVLAPLMGGLPHKLDWERQTRSGVISFCGELYPTYLLQNKFFYAKDHLVAFEPEVLGQTNQYGYDSSSKNWDRYIKDIKKIDTTSVHVGLGAPVIYCGHLDGTASPRVIIINPRLQDLQFTSEILPEVAYQRIDNFISNHLHIIPSQIAEGTTDKLKAEAHGFDKFSFKKQSRK